MGTVYLLHLSAPISGHAGHYLGYTSNLLNRIRMHAQGKGARLMQVAKERHIDFVVAKTWKGDRQLERQLKNRKNSPRLCPVCKSKKVN
jgi:predicted GIY-YIG superfamily endonuclease